MLAEHFQQKLCLGQKPVSEALEIVTDFVPELVPSPVDFGAVVPAVDVMLWGFAICSELSLVTLAVLDWYVVRVLDEVEVEAAEMPDCALFDLLPLLKPVESDGEVEKLDG